MSQPRPTRRTLALCVAALPALISFGGASDFTPSPSLSAADVRDGDIVLMRGMGPIGRLSAMLDGSGESIAHCGIVAHDASGSIGLVHADAVAGMIRFQSLEEQVAGAGGWTNVIVVRDGETRTGAPAAAWALAHADAHTPFDFGYCDESKDRLYCTELIVAAYASAGRVLTLPAEYRVAVPLTGNNGAMHPSGLRQAAGFHVVTVTAAESPSSSLELP